MLPKGKVVSWALVLAVSVVLFLGVFEFRQARAADVDEPPYIVVQSFPDFEVRSYESQIQARTLLVGRDGRNMGGGFRKLARYIFGGNQTGERIAMTAPVGRVEEDSGWYMTFVMPEGYTMESLPKPQSEAVELTEVPARVVAAARFAGWTGQRKVERKIEKLQSALDSAGISQIGRPVLAQYDPPMRLPFWRRNEILIEVSWPVP